MARIRTIKPEFFTSEDIVELDPLARLLYIALWCEADKEGRLIWKPKTFKMRYLPADSCDIDALCDALLTRQLVVLYGDGLAFIPTFREHQNINPRESESKLPEPTEESIHRVNCDALLTRQHARNSRIDPQVGREGKGKERKTREKPRVTSLPENFSISSAVKTWAEKNGYRHLGKHLEHFCNTALAKGYAYADWDAAFRNAIKDNWAKIDNSSPDVSADPRGEPYTYVLDLKKEPLPEGWLRPPNGESRYIPGMGWLL